MAAANAAEHPQPPKEHRKICVRHVTVDTDRTWLETITKEKKAQKDWERKWGFTSDLKKELEEELKKLPRPRYRMNKEKEFKPKVAIQVFPSPPIPNTSSAMVGWRCSHEFWIEKFGPLYVSPKLTIEPSIPPSSISEEEEDDLEDDDPAKSKLDKRRSGLYTTSRIYLR